jgi:hypothetical protein
MCARLYQHVQVNNIIAPEQYDFRKDQDTEIATYTVTNHILKTLDEPSQILGIFCDLTKAFDCMNHDILLDKLVVNGAHGEITRWFKSYLEQRKQRVEICHSEKGKVYSNWEIVKHGVPQGSVLGPLLFLIYINDLQLGINTEYKITLYADDTSVLIFNNNTHELQVKSNMALNMLKYWFTNKGLSFFFFFFFRAHQLMPRMHLSLRLIVQP